MLPRSASVATTRPHGLHSNVCISLRLARDPVRTNCIFSLQHGQATYSLSSCIGICPHHATPRAAAWRPPTGNAQQKTALSSLFCRNFQPRTPSQSRTRSSGLEGFDIAWVEEAQTLSARSLSLLRPTIRKEGSELWANWNPRRKKDAIDEFLRQKRPANAVVVKANWRDNPWFPAVLEDERRSISSSIQSATRTSGRVSTRRLSKAPTLLAI
jgi:terminase large subunit-like protein